MRQQRYDIFLSYRRDSGAQYARTLQLMLEKKGYRVFLDYDELVDEKFSPQIETAIKNSTIYMIILTKGSMARCANEGDWVRHEIEIALDNSKRFVPVNPDNTFDGVPGNVPQQIKSAIEDTQHSEVNFGQTLNATVDMLVKNRIKPYVRRNTGRKLFATATCICAVLILGGVVWHHNKVSDVNAEVERLKQEITFEGSHISWPEDIEKDKLLTIQEILTEMQLIEGGEFIQGAIPLGNGNYDSYIEVEFETPAHQQEVESFYMSKFEVTRGQWNAIMDDNRAGDSCLPIDSVTFAQAVAFAERLFELTGLQFRLPTESEWEYAAKGGCMPEGYMFAGSPDATEVAWYAKNSGGRSHPDMRSTATVNDLFNMSGNVSEWCDTEFHPYNVSMPFTEEKAMVIRGGNYESEEYELTTTHREPLQPNVALPTVGFRLALTK